jgi:hypothetical protein
MSEASVRSVALAALPPAVHHLVEAVLEAGDLVHRLRAESRSAAAAALAAEAARVARVARARSQGFDALVTVATATATAGDVVDAPSLEASFWAIVTGQGEAPASEGPPSVGGGGGDALASAIQSFNERLGTLQGAVDAFNKAAKDACPEAGVVRVPWQLEYSFSGPTGPDGKMVVDFDSGRIVNANGVGVFEDKCALCQSSIQDGVLYGR